ncbi:MAG TPA: hypothetical protein VMJ10_20570 [Kofleriaceae bacterium]|nr:hypothetical protein [Kofleriaceae bacterium]
MRLHAKQYTEPIYDRLADYHAELERHPLLLAPRLSHQALYEFSRRIHARACSSRWSEPDTAGWLLVAETLVPVTFGALAAATARSVEDMLAIFGPYAAPVVEAGMIEAWLEMRELLDGS